MPVAVLGFSGSRSYGAYVLARLRSHLPVRQDVVVKLPNDRAVDRSFRTDRIRRTNALARRSLRRPRADIVRHGLFTGGSAALAGLFIGGLAGIWISGWRAPQISQRVLTDGPHAAERPQKAYLPIMMEKPPPRVHSWVPQRA